MTLNRPAQPPDVLIGIDDTDNEESIGTGRLGRMLAQRLREHGCTILGATRHQHLVHPDIPYTSHNSSCALGLAGRSDPANLHRLCADFLGEHRHEGADPGLCVAERGQVSPELVEFARSTQQVVVTKERALQLAAAANIRLTEHGGTGLGVIGALSAVALRCMGNDGRFLELDGIRRLDGVLTVDEILRSTAIASVVDASGAPVAGGDRVVTRGWVRPQLRDHRAVLIVTARGPGEWSCERDHYE